MSSLELDLGGIWARGLATLLEWGAMKLHLTASRLLTALAGTGQRDRKQTGKLLAPSPLWETPVETPAGVGGDWRGHRELSVIIMYTERGGDTALHMNLLETEVELGLEDNK